MIMSFSYMLCTVYRNNFEIPLISARPTLRSIPCLVVGTPVAFAIFLLMTSTPRALLGENDVPGIFKIFIIFF